jgi:hypothetical protein
MNIDLRLGDCIEILKTRYNITKEGKVFNKKTNKELKFHPDPKGYMKSRMYCPEISNHKDGRKIIKLHRLIAATFLETYNEDLQVNHKNGVKNDNRVENLEMVTQSQNVTHAWNILDSTERKNKLNNRRQKDGKFGKQN